MNALLIDPDAHRRERWRERLRAASIDTVSVDGRGGVCDATAHTSFAATLCRWPLADEAGGGDPADHPSARDFVATLRNKSVWVIALCDDVDDPCCDMTAACEQAIAAGFDDCIGDHIGDAMLRSKLNHAVHLSRLEERLAQAQKLESIGELAAGIAHEINTPIQYVGDNTRFVQQACSDLAAVLNHCQVLVEYATSGPDLQLATERLGTLMQDADIDFLIDEIPTAIRQTLEGVDRVANIVRAMKEFAHPGTSEMALTVLADAIENTIMVARNEWKYVAEVKTDFDPDLVPVPCLPGELNQVLLNLIVNAAQAIGESLGDSPREKGTITIATGMGSGQAEIRISDTGTGIDPENVQRIFNPFFTTKAAGKGTGQGLAIAHTVIVEKHGGTINVESLPGQGTTFVIGLPLEQRSESPQAPAVAASH